MKRQVLLLLCYLSAIFLLLCGCGQNTTVEFSEATLVPGAVEIGNSDYSCITGASKAQEVPSESGIVKVKAFSHRIYNPNSKYIITLTTTLTGKYISEENFSEMSSVSGILSDSQQEGFTVSEHISGDTATIIVYLNQISICHFQYRIFGDGTISYL